MLEHKRFATAATAVSDSIALRAYQSECKFILSFLGVVVIEFMISFYRVLSLLLTEGGKRGVIIAFHAQILTKFTRHVQF